MIYAGRRGNYDRGIGREPLVDPACKKEWMERSKPSEPLKYPEVAIEVAKELDWRRFARRMGAEWFRGPNPRAGTADPGNDQGLPSKDRGTGPREVTSKDLRGLMQANRPLVKNWASQHAVSGADPRQTRKVQTRGKGDVGGKSGRIRRKLSSDRLGAARR